MPSPSQTRDLRVRRLVAMARILLEGGVTYNSLYDKLWAVAQRSWPTVRESTRTDYVISAMKTVRSRPHTETVLPDAVGETPPQEATYWYR